MNTTMDRQFDTGGLVTVSVVVAAAAIALLGMLAPARAEARAPGWKLVAASGPTHAPPFTSERQTVKIGANFTLTFGGDTTSSLSATAPPTGPGSVEEALNALPSISAGGGSVSVTDGALVPGSTGVYVVSFDGGPLAGTDVPMLAVSTGSVELTPSTTLAIVATNVGAAPTTGLYTVAVDLPSGVTTASTPSGTGWSCTAGFGQTSFSCTQTAAVSPGRFAQTLYAPVRVETPVEGTRFAHVATSGGGALPATYDHPIQIDSAPAEAGIESFWAGAFDENGAPEQRAGAHPFLASGGFFFNTIIDSRGMIGPAGDLRDVVVDLPVGFTGNPLATTRCPRDGGTVVCEDASVVGALVPSIEQFGNLSLGRMVNVKPPRGSAAQLSAKVLAAVVTTAGRLRPDDYGVRATTPNIVGDYKGFGGFVTLWGRPGDAAFDSQRCLANSCPVPNPASGTTALLTNPTECTGNTLATLIGVNTWQAPAVFSEASYASPEITGCETVPFDPAVDLATTSSARDSASGLEFDLSIPQEGLLDPNAIATSHLRDVEVDLPEGMSVNPSGATGLAACSDAQMLVATDTPPQCPDASKIGTVEITSPLADHAIGGTMYLGTPKSTDPTSGEMLRLFVVARDDELGIMVKVPGSATADPRTGKLVATFRNNPRVPFDHLSVKLKGGDHGLLATPQTCGMTSPTVALAPWSGTADVTQASTFETAGDCSFGFVPRLAAGMSTQRARGSGSFSFRFSREDGEQWVDGLTAKLPAGLLASVKDVPLCSSAQADAGACLDGSRVGTVDAAAGSGTPFVLERKGTAYLTEGYKGCAYGLAVKVPVVAGPFDASSPETDLGNIVVRQRVCVDPLTAEISVVSDEIPTIWHGIPLRVRSVTVNVDRPGFMLNPSDCAQKQIGSMFDSANGTVAAAAVPFQVADCDALAFAPKLTLGLSGRKQVTTGKHPGVRAQVTQGGVGEAGIETTVVRLPKSLALDPDNAQALCEFEDGTKPDIENRCPKGSIVGRARASSPLLNRPLSGNVYFVKNVRRDPSTGNLIRTLPMLIVALRGEVAVNLKGESSTTRGGKLVNTFARIPDAPITQFNMNITGGADGILAVTRTRRAKINLCASRQIAETDMDGQNGRRSDFDVRMKTPCTKKQTKAAKLRAKRAAAKANRR